MKKKMKIEEVKNIVLGKTNLTKIKIYGKNLDSEEPSFLFKIEFPTGEKYISDSEGFEYETQEDAIDDALDFIVDNASFYEVNKKEMNKRIRFNEDLRGELEYYNENPEDNIEEIPEDFRLDMKK